MPDSRDLARMLRLLLDYVEAVRGEPYTFTEISGFLQERGISLSRSRWSYMLTGEQWKVRDPQLIEALADLFDADPRYLYGTGNIPGRIEAEMRLVLALRAARVREFAARNLADIAPETLEAITEALTNLSDE
jgi:hypothetical protein